MGPPASDAPDGSRPSITKIGDLAAAAGLRRVHMLSWRDLADVEAGGSEVHAATVAKLWAEAGIEVTLRTSYAQGQAPVVTRDGYRVIRRAGRYLVFPRAAGSEMIGRHGQRDALVEIWNGMPFFSPVWRRGPGIVLLHHVHAEMWKMVLGDEAPWAATLGDTIERRIAPLVYRRSRIVTLSQSSKNEHRRGAAPAGFEHRRRRARHRPDVQPWRRAVGDADGDGARPARAGQALPPPHPSRRRGAAPPPAAHA